ncbi:uncharacterized protein ACA1_096740 [Acanthamoeba castellanii str. Neff]|uniref:Uncharacterized protein n=1 Tax=Acanthamoeba castellanii (strain ATCC 30010 / Neff) TaxID=1257118 RepID=L8GJ16_ACACF|nr:uncharacterized protein ACA1_096740 [Acanthamoeba castellanii str. Neff]ELR13002.1 hypothetical protein ACA1_096740 [Acanthamoeba castellanii str. Neff]
MAQGKVCATKEEFDALDFEGLADLVRQRLADTTPADTSYKALTEAVRQAFYRDYSLWDAEFDYIERVVARVLAEASRQSEG